LGEQSGVGQNVGSSAFSGFDLSTTFLKQRLEFGDGFQILGAAGGALEFD
jgi:hypothetical protein